MQNKDNSLNGRVYSCSTFNILPICNKQKKGTNKQEDI